MQYVDLDVAAALLAGGSFKGSDRGADVLSARMCSDSWCSRHLPLGIACVVPGRVSVRVSLPIRMRAYVWNVSREIAMIVHREDKSSPLQ